MSWRDKEYVESLRDELDRQRSINDALRIDKGVLTKERDDYKQRLALTETVVNAAEDILPDYAAAVEALDETDDVEGREESRVLLDKLRNAIHNYRMRTV